MFYFSVISLALGKTPSHGSSSSSDSASLGAWGPDTLGGRALPLLLPWGCLRPPPPVDPPSPDSPAGSHTEALQATPEVPQDSESLSRCPSSFPKFPLEH